MAQFSQFYIYDPKKQHKKHKNKIGKRKNNKTTMLLFTIISWMEKYHKHALLREVGIVQWLDNQTCNPKVTGSSRIIFFLLGQLSMLTLILVPGPPLWYCSSK